MLDNLMHLCIQNTSLAPENAHAPVQILCSIELLLIRLKYVLFLSDREVLSALEYLVVFTRATTNLEITVG